MGYTKPIETEHAIYVVSFEMHIAPDYSWIDHQACDAVVAEGKMSELYTSGLKAFLKKVKKPVILLDPYPTKDELKSFDYRGYLRNGGWSVLTALGVVGITAGFLERKKNPKRVTRRLLLGGGAALAASQLLTPTFLTIPVYFPGRLGLRNLLLGPLGKIMDFNEPIIGASRNAIIAEKLESTMAPMLMKELGRKPKILIQIGAAHASLVDYLRNPKRRAATIEKFRVRIEKGLTKDHLNKAYRVRWDAETQTMKVENFEAPIRSSPVRTLKVGEVDQQKQGPKFSRRALFSRVLSRRRS